MAESDFSFETFAVGETNELAATAARRVAESPGTLYNPLLICGPAGVGKSHLLAAICGAASASDPDLRIHIEGAGEIADRVSAGVIEDRLDPLREALTGFDLLLIDDLERLDGMRRTQLELIAVFRRLVQGRKQVVVASARQPAELAGIHPDLAAFLESGLVAEVGEPDAGTRRRIILRILAARNLDWPEESVEALAEYSLAPGALKRRIEELGGGGEGERPLTPADIHRAMAGEPREQGPSDEFGEFLEDVGRVLAAVVETEPWRRRIGDAILRWEGEGIRTTRLDRALETESPPDVEVLLASFARDAERLLEIRRAVGPDAGTIDDPDDMEAAERLLAGSEYGRRPAAPTPPGRRSAPDPRFLDPTRVVLDLVDVEGRLVEELD